MKERIKTIIEQHENARVEFKTNFGADVIETVCAFSNAVGGSVFVGITDKGKVVGVQNLTHETIKNWLNSIKTNTTPQLFPEILMQELDGKQIAEIIVQEYPLKPVACRGKFYKSFGSSNHLLQADEIAQMQLLSINSSFDAFTVDMSITELDFNLVDLSFRKLKVKIGSSSPIIMWLISKN